MKSCPGNIGAKSELPAGFLLWVWSTCSFVSHGCGCSSAAGCSRCAAFAWRYMPNVAMLLCSPEILQLRSLKKGDYPWSGQS